jgi:hypothetical protein
LSDDNYPVLPHHRKEDGKLMFTNGNLSGCYWYEEIQLFLQRGGRLNKIIYHMEFEKYDYIFKEFVEYFEKIRSLGEEYKTFGKLMINSLYGRLGMNYIDTHSFFIDNDLMSQYSNDIDIISHTELNDIILIEAEINDRLKKKMNVNFQRTKTNLALASAITSKARIKLFNAQQAVIQNGGRLLYSDTDSIIASYKYNAIGQQHGEIF